jgi:alpha-tubulin suppressor-like RCC1 family protein
MVPTQVAGGLTFATISASRTYTASSNNIPSHSCGVTTDGVAYCWGAANFGQLGTGAGGAADSLVRALVPVKVAGQP